MLSHKNNQRSPSHAERNRRKSKASLAAGLAATATFAPNSRTNAVLILQNDFNE